MREAAATFAQHAEAVRVVDGEQRVERPDDRRQGALELLVRREMPANEMRRARASAPAHSALSERRRYARIAGQAQVVVTRERQEFAAVEPHARPGGALERPADADE